MASRHWVAFPCSVSTPAGPAAFPQPSSKLAKRLLILCYSVTHSVPLRQPLSSDTELFWCVCSSPFMPLTSGALRHWEDLIVCFDVVQKGLFILLSLCFTRWSGLWSSGQGAGSAFVHLRDAPLWGDTLWAPLGCPSQQHLNPTSTGCLILSSCPLPLRYLCSEAKCFCGIPINVLLQPSPDQQITGFWDRHL